MPIVGRHIRRAEYSEMFFLATASGSHFFDISGSLCAQVLDPTPAPSFLTRATVQPMI
ncbi:MAG: hypothetical protein MI923_00550 [Phycisphaerales bacterium]|nr:hypothetical protein [Phycisphaerales bacterium]